MMDKLTEALIGARDAAIDEWSRDHGPKYMSLLEGYGDMTRKMEKTQASTKTVRGKLEGLSALLDDEDPQKLQNKVADMEVRAAAVVHNALRLYASVRIMMATVHAHSGGDLLDLLEDGNEPE